MTIAAVTYRYAPNSDAARDDLRPAHVDFLQGLFDAGNLRVSGPTGSGDTAGALLIVEADDYESAVALLDGDPFFTAGLVERTTTDWRTYFGTERVAR